MAIASLKSRRSNWSTTCRPASVFTPLIDPERDIPGEVSRVHGITSDDVVGKPLFAEVAQQLADFFADRQPNRA